MLKKFIFSVACASLGWQAFANDPIVISNQPKAEPVVISNRPSWQDEAFIKFQPQFIAFKNLLEINSHEFLFISAAPDPNNPQQLILYATQAFAQQNEAKKTLILTTLKNLWQQALGHDSGSVVVDISPLA